MLHTYVSIYSYIYIENSALRAHTHVVGNSAYDITKSSMSA